MRPTAADFAILQALDKGIEIERYWTEGQQPRFRRRDPRPTDLVDLTNLRVNFMEGLAREGYISWPSFDKNHKPVLVQLTNKGRQLLQGEESS
jgi:hypothetical protein